MDSWRYYLVMRPETVWLLALASFAIALPARAQERPASIPTDLAIALIGPGSPSFSGAPRFSVGKAPDGFPAMLVPPAPISVVGGMWSGDGGSIVLAVPSAPGEAVATVERFLSDSGWRRPEVPDESRGGFQPSHTGRATYFCRGDEMLTFGPTAGAPRGTYVRVNYLGDAQNASCRIRRTQTTTWTPELPFPRLRAPAGAVSNGGLAGGGGDRLDASTRLYHRTTPEEVAAHYASQLEAGQWKVGLPGVGAGVVVRSLEAADPKGQPWRGTLTAILLTPGELEVSIRMFRVSAAR
jgi:hypothetical protein